MTWILVALLAFIALLVAGIVLFGQQRRMILELTNAKTTQAAMVVRLLGEVELLKDASKVTAALVGRKEDVVSMLRQEIAKLEGDLVLCRDPDAIRARLSELLGKTDR